MPPNFRAKMIAGVKILVLILTYIHIVISFDSRNIAFIIISQSDPYHSNLVEKLKEDIENQAWELEKKRPIIHRSKDLVPFGDWTITPLLLPLLTIHNGSDVRWIIFLEPLTAVRYGKLLEIIAKADEQEDTGWIGHPLSDDEPTYIHHFRFYYDLEEDGGFVYPNFASGFAMSLKLINKLQKRIKSGATKGKHPVTVDASYELAQLVYGDGEGPLLTAHLGFCVVPEENCATYPRQFHSCGDAIPEDSIYFAVNTWSGYHDVRAAVVKKTWGKYITHLHFYSDKADPSLPSVKIDVPNKQLCAKRIAILKHAVSRARSLPRVQWIFLADDDTILGVRRLCEVLSCFQGGDNVTVIGQRYGYGLWTNNLGVHGYVHLYEYITGGGGVSLSVAAAELLSHCDCSEPDSPDDMALGACAHINNITLTHLPWFHQASPSHYPRKVLIGRPVSFHSSPDPLRVYTTWFYRDDIVYRRKKVDEL